MKGSDVIKGKLTASSLAAVYGLLGAVPILTTCLFLGGVTFGEVLRTMLALLNILFFSLAAGMWVSARSKSASHAMAGTVGLLVMVLVLPVILPLSFVGPFDALSPTYSVWSAAAAWYGPHWQGYWGSILLTQAYAWALLAGASARVTRFREEEGADLSARPKEAGSLTLARVESERAGKQRTRLLEQSPVAWLTGRNAGPGFLTWALVLLTGAGIGTVILLSGSMAATIGKVWPFSALFTYAVVVLGVNAVMKTLVAARACRCLAEARQNSSLEILLCAPLQVEEILQGQVVALKRMFLPTALLLLTFEMIGLIWILHGGISASPWAQEQHFGQTLILAEGAFAAFFLLEMQGVAWAGIWFGLCSQNASRAMFKTLFAVVLLPLLLLVLPCLGVALYVLWPIVSFVWARLKLQEQFRALAGQRSISTDETSRWMPFRIPKIVTEPPVEA